MGTIQIKEELQHYIDHGDNKLLHMMQAMAKAYYEEDYTLQGEPMSIKTYKERIKNAKSRIDSGHYTTQEDLEKQIEEW